MWISLRLSICGDNKRVNAATWSRMSARSHSRSLIRRIFLPALTAAFLGYFGFHALSGSYGLLARGGFDARAKELEAELVSLQTEREELEARAALLRPAGLDPDMIDELARGNLNVIAPNEFVIVP